MKIRKQIRSHSLTAGNSHAWLLCADCLEPRSGAKEWCDRASKQVAKAGEMMGLSGWVATSDSFNVDLMLPLVQKQAPGT